MANFNSMVLTNKGQVLYAKAQAGATINFTKMAVGIGAMGSIDPTTLTDLISRKFDIAIQGKTVNTAEKIVLISGTLTNTDMTESVYLQEIGLYAMDPDDGEILYSYASAGQYGDYTSPAANGPYAWNYQVYAAIGNAANVSVTLSNLQYDTGIVNTNTTFSIIKGSNQKDINKSIDNKLKPYLTTNSGNVYTITNSDIDTLTDGYPILVRFNADSTGDISVIVNDSTAHDVVDYFNNKVSNVRNGLIAKLVWDANNSNFQLQGKGGEGDATPNQVLINKKFTNNSGLQVGTMPENGTLNADLNAGQSFIVPAGHTTGGTITANSLASQTPSTATTADIVNGKKVWINGVETTGIATIASLGGYQSATGTVVSGQAGNFYYPNGSSDSVYSIVVSGLNFIPKLVIAYAENKSLTIYNSFLPGPVIKIVSEFNDSNGYVENAYTKEYTLSGTASVTNGGFTLPTKDYGISYSWVAIG